jgi:hypothetical protein
MADPSSDEKFDKGIEKQVIGSRSKDQGGGTDGQPIGGNDSGTGSGTPLTQRAELEGQAATGQTEAGAGSAPPRSMGTRGSEFGQFGDATGPAGQKGQSGTGQADLGTQAGGQPSPDAATSRAWASLGAGSTSPRATEAV